MNEFTQSFNGGHMGPLVDARSDIDLYRSGCRQLENCIPYSHGPAVKRGGTTYMGLAAYQDGASRMAPFVFSAGTKFVLEFGDETLRFWSNRQQVTSGGSPLEVTTPWGADEIYDLFWHQINDVIIVCHPDHKPRIITRVADDNWTLAELDEDYPALRDENISATTLAVYPETVGTGRTVTASAGVFETTHVGAYFRVGHNREAPADKMDIANAEEGTAIKILGTWSVYTGGLWDATVVLERSETNAWAGEEETIRTYTSAYSLNYSDSGNEEDGAYYRLRVSSWVGASSSSNGNNAYAYLRADDARVYGLIKITAVTTDQDATCEVVTELDSSEATTYWSEGAWSDYRGWPRVVGAHEQRLVFGSNEHQPQHFWGSVTGDFYDLRVSTTDDGGFRYQLAAEDGNPLEWIFSQDVLLMGTTGNEWSVSGGGVDNPITPTNVKARNSSAYGSEHIKPVLVGDALLYVEGGGRKVRELVYSFERENWVSPDKSKLASDLLRSRVIETGFSRTPEMVLWCLTADGDILTMTFETAERVSAWAKQTTQGTFEGMAVIPGEQGESSEVWVQTARTLGDGSTARYIEVMEPDSYEQGNDLDIEDMVFTDCTGTYTTGSPTDMVSGADHLDGLTVKVIGDGVVLPDEVPAGGMFKVDLERTDFTFGLPYTATVKPNKVIPPGSGIAGRKIRTHRTSLWFYSTGDAEVAPDGENWEEVRFRTDDDLHGVATTLFTGEREVYLGGNYLEWSDLSIRSREPLPLVLTALVQKFNVGDE